MRQEVFDWIEPGEELVDEPFRRLAAAGRLLVYPYDGFWACMDTFKDKQLLEDLYSRGQVPWEVWKTNGSARGHGSAAEEARRLSGLRSPERMWTAPRAGGVHSLDHAEESRGGS